MMDAHPRKMSALPVAMQKYQGESQVAVVQNTAPNTDVATPSIADDCQLLNLSRNAAIKRNKPMTVKDEANTSIHAVLPTAGWVTTSMPIGNPETAGTR